MIGGDDVTKNDVPHVSAAIQLSNEDKHPSRGDTIKYIYTDSQHKNPLCRVIPVENTSDGNNKEAFSYDKEKYREMILDAAETVLGYFGFDRTLYVNKKNTSTRKWWWLEELRQEREKDIRVEMTKSDDK
jgi:DNA polymerase elongation subunit (family B)